MAISIHYQLSKDGQKTAILNGQDARRCQVLTIDNTNECHDLLLNYATVDDDGSARLNLFNTNYSRDDDGLAIRLVKSLYFEVAPEPSLIYKILLEQDSLKEEIDSRQKARDEELRIKAEEKHAAFTAEICATDDLSEWIKVLAYKSKPAEDSQTGIFLPAGIYWSRIGQAARDRLSAERDRMWLLCVEQEETKAAEQAAEEEEFVDQLAIVVKTYGSEEQFARWEAGYLPQEEAYDILRNHLFESLDSFERYQRLNSRDYVHEDDCHEEVKFSSAETDSLTAEQFDIYRRVKQAAPEAAAVTPRLHMMYCDACNETVTRMGIQVLFTWHGTTFGREYQG